MRSCAYSYTLYLHLTIEATHTGARAKASYFFEFYQCVTTKSKIVVLQVDHLWLRGLRVVSGLQSPVLISTEELRSKVYNIIGKKNVRGARELSLRNQFIISV